MVRERKAANLRDRSLEFIAKGIRDLPVGWWSVRRDLWNKSDLCVYVLCVMCLKGARYIYVFMLERGEVDLCVMCYVLEHITRQHITHNRKILFIKIQFLLLLLLRSITQYQY
jgi:hypothetical protein